MHKSFGSNTDWVACLLMWGIGSVILGIFSLVVGDVVWHGLAGVSWEFLSTAPRDAGRAGGIIPILISTGLLLSICLVVAIPIGLGAAIFLAECTSEHHAFGRVVRISLDVLTAVPSIVFGLFGYAFFSHMLGMGFSLVSGGLTLACMVLPILIRATEEGFRTVPNEYRLGAAALGLSRMTTLMTLLLPAAMPGLMVGVILGTGRAMAETAALIYTSGYVDRMPESLMDSGRALSLHIFDLSMNVPGGNANAYASAVVLIGLLLVMNTLASWVAGHWLKRRMFWA
ncbi:MAG: phosphate ABC transporter permease PstA [Nitrospirales bacterium]|nr:phosphate ABC transporter permease PstA [Nitrospirales bacterium]